MAHGQPIQDGEIKNDPKSRYVIQLKPTSVKADIFSENRNSNSAARPVAFLNMSLRHTRSESMTAVKYMDIHNLIEEGRIIQVQLPEIL